MRVAVLGLALAACGFRHGAVAFDAPIFDAPDAARDAPDAYVAPFYAASCAELAAHQTVANDSSVTLYAGGDAAKPWTAFCHDSLEYLTASSATANYSQYTAGAKSPGSNVRTSFARLRIDPTTFAVDICDQTFATSTGMLSHDPANNDPAIIVTSMPLGVAMDCLGDGSTAGVGAIDVTATPFAVTSSWTTQGNGSAGNATIGSLGRRVTITGGGNCGWNEPTNGPFNPFNTCTNKKLVTLAYSP